ncbi:MAG TPA: redoxin domain-containing protein [Gemmataceae bacterium]|nr:redoxin domain-containing protein [Gemmataceae bacterium]
MAATLYLLGCILIPGQTMTRPPQAPHGALTQPRSPGRVLVPSSGDWLLVPRLNRSQELVYRGTFTEEARGGRVQFSRSYRLETRVLVLDTPPNGAEVAVLTLLKHRPSSGGTPADQPAAPTRDALSSEAALVSVRLERAHVNLQGKITSDSKANLLVPLDGAPTLECGVFIALPDGRISAGQEWTVLEGDRPPLTWRAAGTEMAAGNQCIKLVGEQKSDDWDHPRGDRSAWLRRETVWLAPHLGLAARVEREIFQREPAHREATQRSLLRIDLESSFQLSGQAGDSRRQEITQVLSFRDTLTPLLTQPTRYGPHLAALLRRIDKYLEEQPETPYRPAVLQVKRRVEAAQRGETPPEPVHDIRPVATGAAIGQRAPDFIATNFSGGSSAQLRHWMGKPVVLVFYHPSSQTSSTVLRFAQQLQSRYSQRIYVAGMSISDKADLVRRQQAELGLTFPLLSAGGVRGSFGVASTPKIVLLDGNNIIRGEYLGWAWGGETAREVEQELKRWLPVGVSLPAAPQPR